FPLVPAVSVRFKAGKWLELDRVHRPACGAVPLPTGEPHRKAIDIRCRAVVQINRLLVHLNQPCLWRKVFAIEGHASGEETDALELGRGEGGLTDHKANLNYVSRESVSLIDQPGTDGR